MIGATEIEARREYAASLRQWQRIAALPDPPWAYRWPLVGPEPTSTDGGEQQ